MKIDIKKYIKLYRKKIFISRENVKVFFFSSGFLFPALAYSTVEQCSQLVIYGEFLGGPQDIRCSW